VSLCNVSNNNCIEGLLQKSSIQLGAYTKIYNTLVTPTLFYSSEIWSIKIKDKSKITIRIDLFEMLKKYTWKDSKGSKTF
jgi:hypothetical protein